MIESTAPLTYPQDKELVKEVFAAIDALVNNNKINPSDVRHALSLLGNGVDNCTEGQYVWLTRLVERGGEPFMS